MDQTIMTKEGSAKIGNFIIWGLGSYMYARAWLYKSLQWICIIFYIINIHHIDCYCIMEYIMLFSHAIVDFHLLYDGAVDMQIWSLLTRRWLKLTEQDKTGTQLIAFIHWIKDLSLESMHWNLKFIGHKSVFRFLRNNPCSSSSQVSMAVHWTIVHLVFVWLLHRICWMISSLPVSICQMMFSKSYVAGKQHVCWCWESM